MFQSYAFQPFGFQVAGVEGAQTQAETSGGSPKESYSYFPAWQQAQTQKIKKTKTEIEKLDSVLVEYQRREFLAAESLRIAEESERLRLVTAQNELISEINRLLVVKAELMARKKREEDLLFMMMASRKRLRAFNLTTKRI